jgi:GYF domain 2
MEANQWHVQLGEETFGPLTTDELNQLARKGCVTRETPISSDAANWTAANSFKELEFGPSSVAASNPPRAGAEKSSTIGSWLVHGVTGAAFTLAILVLVGLLTSGAQKSDSVQKRGSVADDTPALTSTGKSTFDYWNRASAALKTIPHAAADANSDPDGAATQYRAVASTLEILPTKGVDWEAVRSILAASAVLRELADDIEESHDAGRAGEAFVKGLYGGWSGDFGPAMSEWDSLENTRRTRLQHYKVARQLASETRAILSSRHSVEFPPL